MSRGNTASEAIRWTANAKAATIQDVRVNLRRLDAAVAEQFLDGADVVSVLEKSRRE